MISEKNFCTHYSAFWRETLPNLEPVVRGINLGYERIWSPLLTKSDAKRRDFISEIGYRLSFNLGDDLNTSQLQDRIEIIAKTVFAELSFQLTELWNEEYYITNSEIHDVKKLAELIRRYLMLLPPHGESFVRPSYSGHGILGMCYGDFEKNDALVEMKYVSRNFRGTDIRQLLTYSALRYYETGTQYRKLYLFNPLRGIHFPTTIKEILSGAAGITPVEFYKRMSYVLSSGEISH